ncbi:MAG: hypothetical protein E8A46_25400 [Bradyrhizobium sp.]|jgi:hypothetical protein|uniref:hypothetical protein n=1 Tax=Bradyrhizobium sp. TaxID=376 RepID=UPI001225C7D9|nr:hypothetical protein [Bradyrhizobium sp.]THD46893.1 MAG: hypothetical protein E8A46_25400 [Bradyrhizobium sp.]
MQVGEYVSPDGQLRFLVACPDWTIGFEGFPSHTHGSLLAAGSGQDEISAIKRFVADLTGNISVIVLTRRSGVLTDVWITDDPATALSNYKRYGWPDETIEFRRWDGTVVKV